MSKVETQLPETPDWSDAPWQVGEDEPNEVVWTTGLGRSQADLIRAGWRSTGAMAVYVSERAAWLDREREIARGWQPKHPAPYQLRLEEAIQEAIERGCSWLRIRDEAGSIVREIRL